MFQSFDEVIDFSRSADRVAHLRRLISDARLDGVLVPRADEHQGEYIPPSAARLAWLTGFTGSAGAALVLTDSAYLFVDGRYTLQVRDQVDLAVFQPVNSVETGIADFLKARSGPLRIGIDPWLHTTGEVKALGEALSLRGGELVPLSGNLVDRIWNDRPAPPQGAVTRHPDTLAGQGAADKLGAMMEAVAREGADACVLTDPSSIAWMLNIRGSDVSHTPLPLGFAIVPAKGRAQLFMDPAKFDPETAAYLRALVDLADRPDFEPALKSLGAERTVMLDPQLAAERIAALVREAGGIVLARADPARLPRAIKNEAEQIGSRAAHLRDGAAITTFLHWLEGKAPGTVTEIAAAQELEAARVRFGEADGMALQDIAFDTIAGSGPNGAIVHYRVNRDSNRLLGEGELFLLDSGAQYRDGTTDITRTIPIGAPKAEMSRAFTLVLKGMIAISTARFPKGTRGVDLDPLARIALWKAGADYAHGTGHGVGSYLSVHEGPQSISRRGMAVLEAGMILSNEPGYYRAGAFGIRIENLILVQVPTAITGGDLPMHGFETLTLAPIDRRLIDASLLTGEEIDWLDRYHARVLGELSPVLTSATVDWLAAMTKPLGR